MNVALIIINFNGENDTIACLESIEEQIKQKELLKVFLIENNNHNIIDVKRLNINFKIEQIINFENVGFAEGNNIGIRLALDEKFEYIGLINNDTVFIDNSLSDTIEILERNTDIGIIGLVNYYYDNPTKIWQAGFKISKKNMFSSIEVFDKNNDFVFCDYVPGSSLIARSKVWEIVGLLNKDYFAYYEEVDFCLRAKKNGFNVAFNPKSVILHKVGVSSISSIKLYLRTRNIFLFLKSHVGKAEYFKQSLKYFLKSILTILIKSTNRKKDFKILAIALNDYFKNNMYKGSLDKISKL